MDQKIFGPVRLKSGALGWIEEEAQVDEAATAHRAHAVVRLLRAMAGTGGKRLRLHAFVFLLFSRGLSHNHGAIPR